MAKKDKEESTEVDGVLTDGAKVILSQGGSNAVFQQPAAKIQPGVEEGALSPSPVGALYQSDAVVSRKTPKGFVAEGRPVDIVQSAEKGDLQTIGWAVQTFTPVTTDGQFLKQVLLRVLEGMA